MADVQRLVGRLAQVQIDSVNVVARAHLMPAFSRLGGYDTGLLQRAAQQPPRRLFEYWGHAASLLDVQLEPALRWRMQRARDEAWRGIVRIEKDHPGLVDEVYERLSADGPMTARQFEHDEVRSREQWGWNWSAVKTSLEWLFWQGRVAVAGRNTQFERSYDIPERVLPPAVLATPTPTTFEAQRTLLRRAAVALGVGTETCLNDYFRTRAVDTRPALASLVEDGDLVPVAVDGWAKPAYLWHAARIPRRVEARALVSPFDSVVFERARLAALFGFHYRIEIYVPAPQRTYGYYVYPFLLGDRFAARVDLKADRASGRLLVRAAWYEPGPDEPAEVARHLAAELAALAGWLELSDVVVEGRGDLAPDLARTVSR